MLTQEVANVSNDLPNWLTETWLKKVETPKFFHRILRKKHNSMEIKMLKWIGHAEAVLPTSNCSA